MPRGTQVPVRSLTAFAYGTVTPSGPPSQCGSANSQVSHSSEEPQLSPTGPPTPALQRLWSITHRRFGLLPFRSPLLRECSLFLGLLRCFSSPAYLPQTYVFSLRVPGFRPGGFPHSGISGSMPADGSPKLFAVNHALHRLLTPRHPPCALSSLIHT